MTCCAVQKVHKAYKNSPLQKRLTFILYTNVHLATQASLNKQTITGLITSLKVEKKKRSHRKRLNLVGEEDSGPQFYSPSCVHRALEFQSKEEADEQKEQDRIESNKATAITNRQRKEEEKAAHALQSSIHKQAALEKRLQKTADIQVQKEQRQANQLVHKAQLLLQKAQKSAPKAQVAALICRKSAAVAKVDSGVAKVKIVTSRGRATMRPMQWSN
jgi:hypothetical protein